MINSNTKWHETYHCDRCGIELKRYGNGRCRKCAKLPICVSPFLDETLKRNYPNKHKRVWMHEWFDGKKWVPLFHLCYPTKESAQKTLWTRWPDVRNHIYPNDVYNESVAKKYIPEWFMKRFRIRQYRPTP